MVVGVTGGVGSGKTVFARELCRLGAVLIEADEIAREMVDEREDIREAIRNRFGIEIFDESGGLKRRELGRIVFSDHGKLQELNQILQKPLMDVVQKRVSLFQKKEQGSVVVVDMATLYETGVESLCDTVVVVNAPLEKRTIWLSEERGWSREEISERIKAQMSVREKMRKADVVIHNSGTLDDLNWKAEDLFKELFHINNESTLKRD